MSTQLYTCKQDNEELFSSSWNESWSDVQTSCLINGQGYPASLVQQVTRLWLDGFIDITLYAAKLVEACITNYW